MTPQLGITLDPQAAAPLFRQLADQIVARIESGAFPEGYRLPPTRAMADAIGAHRNTVVRAYEELQANGMVESVVGRGTFVTTPDDLSRAYAGASIGTSSGGGLAPMAWGSVLSRATQAEALTRVDRLPRTTPRRGVGRTVDLTAMQPPADLLPTQDFRLCVDHVLRTRGPKALAYSPAEGLPVLREFLVEDLARMGVPARAEDILVTCGSQQALDLIARALVDPGDSFAVESETYQGTIQLLSIAGARMLAIPGDADGPSLEALDAQATAAKGLYLMPNSHNPTGMTISAQRRHELVRWSHRHGVPLIEDDYGADLELSDTPPPPAMKALDADVIYVSTFSKRLIPALRVGFIVCPPPLKAAITAIKHSIGLGSSSLLQYALAEFLERGYLRKHLRRTLPVYRARRDALEEAFAKHLPEDIAWQPLERGLVTWLDLPADLPAEDVFFEAQREGVLVRPGSLNSVSGRAQDGLRICICNESEERLAEGVKRLAKAIANVRSNRTASPERPRIGAI